MYTLFEDGTISGGIIMLDSAQKAKEKWYKYFMNTYAQTPIVIDSGQGSTVVDLDGKNILILQVDMEHYPQDIIILSQLKLCKNKLLK